MDISMSDAPSAHSRKRAARTLEHNSNSDDDDNHPIPADSTNTPSKRLRNPQGDSVAIHEANQIHFNAHPLFRELAYTRLFVTANYTNYAPSSSPVLLCLLPASSSVDEQRLFLYHALCETLPTLYPVSPTLQALAIAFSSAQDAPATATGSRILPIIQARELESWTREQLEDLFHSAITDRVDQDGDEACLLLLFDPRGTCIWTSHDLLLAGLDHQEATQMEVDGVRGDATIQHALTSILAQVLQSKCTEAQPLQGKPWRERNPGMRGGE